jgi:hypothetical protein
MSHREIDRTSLLGQVRDQVFTARHGADFPGLTSRGFQSLRRAWEPEGDRAVVRGSRGSHSKHAKPPEFRAWAQERAEDPRLGPERPRISPRKNRATSSGARLEPVTSCL